MLYILDTNVVSDIMDDRAEIAARLSAITPGDKVATCAIVRGEVLFGVRRIPDGRRRDALNAKALKVLSILPYESTSEAAADHYADIKISRRKAGLSLDENDLWIAATARSLGAVLVTRDRDFDGIENLTIENWGV